MAPEWTLQRCCVGREILEVVLSALAKRRAAGSERADGSRWRGDGEPDLLEDIGGDRWDIAKRGQGFGRDASTLTEAPVGQVVFELEGKVRDGERVEARIFPAVFAIDAIPSKYRLSDRGA